MGLRFNPNHDPKNGEFSSDGGSGSSDTIKGSYKASSKGGGTFTHEDGTKSKVDEDGRFEHEGKGYYVDEDGDARVEKSSDEKNSEQDEYDRVSSPILAAGIKTAKDHYLPAKEAAKGDYDEMVKAGSEAQAKAAGVMEGHIKALPDKDLDVVSKGELGKKFGKASRAAKEKAALASHQMSLGHLSDLWMRPSSKKGNDE